MTTPSDSEIIATITDELPVGIWVARAPGGEFVHANRAFSEIMGMGARDDVAVGEYAAPYGIHTRTGELYPESRMPFLRALEAGETVVVDDIVIHRADGGRVFIRATARPVRNVAGVITHVVIAFIDISREVLAEQARLKSDAELERRARLEAVGKLAAGVAHDFNNVLAVIRGLASGLARDERDPARREDLALIDDAIGSAASLVRSLLDFSRRRPARIEPLSINDPVARVLGMLERASGRGITFSRELASARQIFGDHGALEQVVMNLVVNACEAMPDGGRVHVRTYDAPHDGTATVFLEVSDTGHGIPPTERERIFEPYVTTRETTSRRGTGLGLATVSGIVESHGGVVDVVRSDASGTTMRARFPALDDPPSPTDATPKRDPGEHG